MSSIEFSATEESSSTLSNNLAPALSHLEMTNENNQTALRDSQQHRQSPPSELRSYPNENLYFDDHQQLQHQGDNAFFESATTAFGGLSISGPPPGFNNDEDDESYETSLFLGDLSVYSTEKDIRKIFSPYGIIERIRIKRGSSGKPHLSYGFITFRDRESAEHALQELNGVMFLGRCLRLGWAEPKTQIKIPKIKSEVLQTAQIHVSYISKQIDMLITEETLRSIFGKFGQVVDVAIKKSQFDKRLRLQNGYGFIHYPLTQQGLQAAVDATYNVHQVTIDRVTYDCSLSRYLDEFQLPEPQIFAEFARREIKAVNSHTFPQSPHHHQSHQAQMNLPHQQHQHRFFQPSARSSPHHQPQYHSMPPQVPFTGHNSGGINPTPSRTYHSSQQGISSSSYHQLLPTAISAPPRFPYNDPPRAVQQSVPPSSSIYPTYSTSNRVMIEPDQNSSGPNRRMENPSSLYHSPRSVGLDHLNHPRSSYANHYQHPNVPTPSSAMAPFSTDSPNLAPSSTYRDPFIPVSESAGLISYSSSRGGSGGGVSGPIAGPGTGSGRDYLDNPSSSSFGETYSSSASSAFPPRPFGTNMERF